MRSSQGHPYAYSDHEDCCAPHHEHHRHHRHEEAEYHRLEFHPLVDAVRRVCELIETGPRIGLGLLDCLHDLEPLLQVPRLPRLTVTRTSRCDCEIPRPCWLPQNLGDVYTHVCPGGTATLRFRVTNCGATRRDIQIEGAPTVTPASLSLGPEERGFSVVSATAPPDAHHGYEKEYLVWVRGCRNHFVRWTVVVSHHQQHECQELYVEDCPDLIHHWYDHFYCDRPCQ
jgi:hypothetical protein